MFLPQIKQDKIVLGAPWFRIGVWTIRLCLFTLLFTLQGAAECHHTGKVGLSAIPFFLELQPIIFLGE